MSAGQRPVRTYGAALAGFAAGFGLVYLLVLRFATNNLVFTALSNMKELPKAYCLYFALPLLAIYLAGLVYSVIHLNRLSVPCLMLNAFAIGGMLAYVLYNHYSFSQAYFALAAVPTALLTALPAGEALIGRLGGRAKLRCGAAGLLACALLVCAFGQAYGNREDLRRGAQAALPEPAGV